MKVLASLAVAIMAQEDGADYGADGVERGFNYGGFNNYDMSAFDTSYGYDNTDYTGLYEYVDDTPAVGAGREVEVDDDKTKGERYFFTTVTTTTVTTTTTTAVVGDTHCWKCDAMTYADCASTGSYEECILGDKDCCFVEVRFSHQKLQQLCTGCKDKTACEDNMAENFRGTHMDNDDQCRPEMLQQKTNSRHEQTQSVCRQCFNTCDKASHNGAFCFGSITNDVSKTPAEFMIPFATSSTLLNMETPHGRLDWAGSIGIPTWVLVDGAFSEDASAESDISTSTASNVFFNTGANNNGKVALAGDSQWTVTDMTYWSLAAGNKAWWQSDLKTSQSTKYAAQVGKCTAGTTEIFTACAHDTSLLLTIGGSF